MIIQTTNLPPGQAIQPDMRAHGTAPEKALASPVVPASPPVTKETLENAVAAMNQIMDQTKRSIEFSVDTDTRKTVVKMVDTSTGELIRQFPSEAALAISREIEQFQQGLLIKQQA